MGMQTDVKSVPVAATGTVYAARTRLKGLLVMPGVLAGSLVIRDGGASGTVLMTIPTLAGDSTFPVIIPGRRCAVLHRHSRNSVQRYRCGVPWLKQRHGRAKRARARRAA